WLANIIAGVVERSEQGSQFLANIVRVLIMGLVLAMGLKAMGIADSIVNLAFGLTLGAVAVAFALSFGLGGQEAASRFLRKMQDKMDREHDEAKAKSALTPKSSTQDKFAASIRENTPSAATSTPPVASVISTPVVTTKPVVSTDSDTLGTSTSTPLGSDTVDITHIETDDNNTNPTNDFTNGSGFTNIDNDNLK
ncbi:MAG: hypothetical protein WAZ74_10930, partial [Psychrobacter sp.]